MEYTTDRFNTGINNEKVEFYYKKERGTTEIINGYDISGNWSPSSATENGKIISLQEVFGSSIRYGGYLTLNYYAVLLNPCWLEVCYIPSFAPKTFD